MLAPLMSPWLGDLWGYVAWDYIGVVLGYWNNKMEATIA